MLSSAKAFILEVSISKTVAVLEALKSAFTMSFLLFLDSFFKSSGKSVKK
jgi:hypothetical protein